MKFVLLVSLILCDHKLLISCLSILIMSSVHLYLYVCICVCLVPQIKLKSENEIQEMYQGTSALLVYRFTRLVTQIRFPINLFS